MRIVQRLRQTFSTAAPTVGVDIATDRVSAVVLGRRRTKPHLVGYGTELLPNGTIIPSASRLNVVDRGAVVDALRRILKQLPGRQTRIGLTVPDSVAKVSFLQFETVPDRSVDLDRLIAWQLRKAVPFRLEDAQIAYAPGVRHGEYGREFIVELVRRDIIEEYESVCVDAGIHAGVVDLASMNLINTAIHTSQAPSGDWLLVHSTQDSNTLAIIRGHNLIFFRCRPTATEDEFSDLVHQSAMYYQDRLGGDGLKRAVVVEGREALVNENGSANTISEALEYRLAMPVNRLEFDLGDTATLDPIAAPIGLLLREESSAA